MTLINFSQSPPVRVHMMNHNTLSLFKPWMFTKLVVNSSLYLRNREIKRDLRNSANILYRAYTLNQLRYHMLECSLIKSTGIILLSGIFTEVKICLFA